MYRVLLTGSQTWNDPDLIGFVLDSILRAHPDMVLVHGDAPARPEGTGADSMGRAWAIIRSVPHEPHPAQWRPNGIYHPGAGFLRNEAMVDSEPDTCVAFAMPCKKAKCSWRPEHPTHGTSHCMTLARVAGIPVQPYRPDYRLQQEGSEHG